MRDRAAGRSVDAGTPAYRRWRAPRARGGCCSRAGRERPRIDSSLRSGLPDTHRNELGELLEVLLEEGGQFLRLHVVGSRILPRRAGIEEGVRYAGHVFGHV